MCCLLLQELEEENARSRQEKEDLEAEVLAQSSLTADSELTSLKRMKRELESKVEELEEELEDVNIKLVTGEGGEGWEEGRGELG